MGYGPKPHPATPKRPATAGGGSNDKSIDKNKLPEVKVSSSPLSSPIYHHHHHHDS